MSDDLTMDTQTEPFFPQETHSTETVPHNELTEKIAERKAMRCSNRMT